MGEKIIQSPIGKIKITSKQNYITKITQLTKDTTTNQNSDETCELAEKQLKEYFSGKRTEFELPIKPEGTEYQKKVWKTLQEIPYGKTASYKEITEKIGIPGGSRAVGNANNKNPITIVIPCHRIINHNGKIGGYGTGISKKLYLLELEQKNKKSQIPTRN